MPSATTNLFEQIATRGHIDVLENVSGTLLFDIADPDAPETWWVSVDNGDVRVERGAGNGTPTCLVRCTSELLERIAGGEANAMAAVLRGEMVVDGDLQFLMMVQRVFPGPPGATHPTAHIEPAGRQ